MVTNCGCCFEEEEEVFDPGFESTEIIGEFAIWKPTVTEEGVISWEKNASETPPEAQNIRGPQGPAGADGQDGTDGTTPTIGTNGNWFLGSTDTGKPSRGEQGIQGIQGPAGADGQDGVDGTTPTIGNNGNWYLGSTDTGKPSRGEQGIQGIQGPAGADGLTTSVTVNGETFTQSGGNIDLGTVLRQHQSLADYRTSTAQDVIDGGKLDKFQGVTHAGEFLIVGSDGNVTTLTLSAWEGGSY